MNYEEKLREIINSNSEYYPSEDKTVLAKYFPELKEPEDEKIKREIVAYINELADLKNEKIPTKWLAWLEKQREQAKFESNPVWSEEDEEMLKWLCRIIHSQRLDKAITLKEESELGEWIDKWLNYNPQTKQSEQPTNKIKPRFKEGDWITDGRITCKVLGVTGKSYEVYLHNDDYCHFETDIQTVDQYYRLWTIQDTKDGDVLVDEDNNIGIYVGKNDDFWHSCIYLGCDGCLHGINVGAYHKHKNTKPAAKEQRNLLFQKIKEEGYEWDAQKKEVKKPIDEVKPRFKEGDFIMNNDITEDGKPEIFKIIKVCSSWYDVENVYDGRQTMITFSQDYTCHLWTIDDAKQGDILMVDNEFIVVLYRKMTDGTERKDTSILTEYEYDINDNTFTKGSHLFYCDICPATYTQREVLTNYIQQELNWEK